MKRYIYTVPLLSVLILGSCQDDEIITQKEIKLDYYVESFDIDDFGTTPQLKVAYEYETSGRLRKYTVLSSNQNTSAFDEQRYFAFSYANVKVEHIKGYLPTGNSPYIEYSYQYLPNDDVLKIIENNHTTGINSDANFTYAENGAVKVSYVFSNGGSFEYEFDFASENVLSDKTTRGSTLCSDGQYTYDQYNNPFKNLGYVDYLLTNLSVNNRPWQDAVV